MCPKVDETKKPEAPEAPAPKPAPAPEAKPEKPITDADVVEMNSGDVESADEPAPAPAPTPGEAAEVVPSPAKEASPVEKPEAPKPEAPAPVAKKYKLGNKEFNSAEELAAYAQAKLEKGEDLLDAVAAVTAAKEPEVELEDIWFEDPKRAIQMIEERITSKIEGQLRAKDDIQAKAAAREALWDKFYSANPDLKAGDLIVREEFQKLLAADKDMPIEQGMAKLAEASRRRLEAIADAVRPARELPAEPAVVGGSSGADVPPSRSEAPSEGFIAQIRKVQKRG